MSAVLPHSPTETSHCESGFSPEELHSFNQNGFVICRGLAPAAICQKMLQVACDHVARQVEPLELEAEVDYPGSPESQKSPGGSTIRRLKQAHSRDVVFTDWVSHPALLGRLRQLLGPQVVMPLAHHNCVMTKQPEFSSDTGWHRDIRYWSFGEPNLVSVWLALGEEHPENGGLWVIPGSHRIEFQSDQLDSRLFFRTDAPKNQQLIESRRPVHLSAGDVLFFHARTLHSASRNHTAKTKYSAVFTFRPAANTPIEGTRSSVCELLLPGLSGPES